MGVFLNLRLALIVLLLDLVQSITQSLFLFFSGVGHWPLKTDEAANACLTQLPAQIGSRLFLNETLLIYPFTKHCLPLPWIKIELIRVNGQCEYIFHIFLSLQQSPLNTAFAAV